MFPFVGASANFPVSKEAVMSVVLKHFGLRIPTALSKDENPKGFCLCGLYLLIFTTVRIDAEKLLQDIVK